MTLSSKPDVIHCNHLWEPRADEHRIWQVCLKCGTEEHVTTHHDALMHNLAYILREDADR